MRNSKTLEFFNNMNKYQNIEKPVKRLTESEKPINEAEGTKPIELFMNTWANYNVNGANIEDGGWMSVEQAKEFLEKHKDGEPFINDTNNCPIEISEYDNPWQKIEELEKIEELDSDNLDIFLAILEDQDDGVDAALKKLKDGDYTFFAGVDNDYDLGKAYVDMVGGLEGVSNKENYVDEDAYRESWREAAVDNIRENNPDLDEDSEEFESKVEEWLDDTVDEQLELAKDNGEDLSDYFDYEALGRDLNIEGYYYAKTGAIKIS